jgi:hypothetical protein
MSFYSLFDKVTICIKLLLTNAFFTISKCLSNVTDLYKIQRPGANFNSKKADHYIL